MLLLLTISSDFAFLAHSFHCSKEICLFPGDANHQSYANWDAEATGCTPLGWCVVGHYIRTTNTTVRRTQKQKTTKPGKCCAWCDDDGSRSLSDDGLFRGLVPGSHARTLRISVCLVFQQHERAANNRCDKKTRLFARPQGTRARLL